jgi:hypothetical protein
MASFSARNFYSQFTLGLNGVIPAALASVAVLTDILPCQICSALLGDCSGA